MPKNNQSFPFFQKRKQSGFSAILIIIAIILCFIIVGIGVYFIFLRQKSDLSGPPSLPFATQKQVPVKGCGNNLCEAEETFDSCPPDCILPSSIEPTLKSILITESDLPLTPAPNKEPWVKQIDIQIDETYVDLAPRDIKPYTGWQVTYYPLPHDSLAWIEHMILVYPVDKIESIFNTIDTTLATVQKAEPSAKIEELPSPSIGEDSRAFRVAFPNRPFHTIVFYKKGFYETFTLRGTAFEYNVLEDIARKAADKIQ